MRFAFWPVVATCLFASACSADPGSPRAGSEAAADLKPPPPLPPPSEMFVGCVSAGRSMAISAGPPAACAEMYFQSQMSTAFALRSVRVAIDGTMQYTKTVPEGAPALADNVAVFIGRIAPGEHEIQVELDFVGHGEGVFAYLKGYKFHVRSTHTFHAEEDRSIRMHLLAYEKGGITTPLEERPAVRFVTDPERPAEAP